MRSAQAGGFQVIAVRRRGGRACAAGRGAGGRSCAGRRLLARLGAGTQAGGGGEPSSSRPWVARSRLTPAWWRRFARRRAHGLEQGRHRGCVGEAPRGSPARAARRGHIQVTRASPKRLALSRRRAFRRRRSGQGRCEDLDWQSRRRRWATQLVDVVRVDRVRVAPWRESLVALPCHWRTEQAQALEASATMFRSGAREISERRLPAAMSRKRR